MLPTLPTLAYIVPRTKDATKFVVRDDGWMSSVEIPQALATSMTCAIAVFAAALVALNTTWRRDQSAFLALYLALYAATAAGELFLLTGAYHVAPHLTGAQLPLKTLLGPAVYYYTRAMTARSPRSFSWRDGFALAGPLLVLVAVAPFYALTATQKLALADPQTRDPETFALALTSCALAFAIFVAFGFGYIGAAIIHLLKHRRQVRDHYANVERRTLNWLPVMLVILAASFIWHVGGSIWGLAGTRPEWASVASAFADLAFTGAFALCGLLQRPAYEPGVADEAPVSYARSGLNEERMARIAAKLQAALVTDRLFENPELSLRLLSDHLGVSENHLSETFSRHLETSFFDFVNVHRIEEARRRLIDSEDGVLDIAHAVGFNSRSTFNAAFKKHVGETPSAHRSRGKNPGGLAAPSAS